MSESALRAQLDAMVEQYGLADVSEHPSLSRRTQSLVALAACGIVGTDKELAHCINDATANGVRQEEIAEVFLHLGIIAGLPVARQAFATAQRVWARRKPDEVAES